MNTLADKIAANIARLSTVGIRFAPYAGADYCWIAHLIADGCRPVQFREAYDALKAAAPHGLRFHNGAQIRPIVRDAIDLALSSDITEAENA